MRDVQTLTCKTCADASLTGVLFLCRPASGSLKQMMEAFKWISGKIPIKNLAALMHRRKLPVRRMQYPGMIPRFGRMSVGTGPEEHTVLIGC